MAPLSFRNPGRCDPLARAMHCLSGMVIGVVAVGMSLFVLAVIAKHIMAGLGLLAALRWIQDLAVFGSQSAQLGLWLFVAATFAAVFLLLFLGLIPQLSEVAKQRARRVVNTPGPASWSSGWAAASFDPTLEPPESEDEQPTQPPS